MHAHRPTVLDLIKTLLAAIAIAASSWIPAAAAPPGHALIGDWKLISVLDGVEVTSIDEHQAQRLVGRTMSIAASGIRFGDQTCGAPSFDSMRVKRDPYVREEARISAAKLHLPDPVTVVDLGCTRAFVTRKNRIVVFWDGFFFLAERIQRPTGATG